MHGLLAPDPNDPSLFLYGEYCHAFSATLVGSVVDVDAPAPARADVAVAVMLGVLDAVSWLKERKTYGCVDRMQFGRRLADLLKLPGPTHDHDEALRRAYLARHDHDEALRRAYLARLGAEAALPPLTTVGPMQNSGAR